jgi:two-component sensor histidine kinase
MHKAMLDRKLKDQGATQYEMQLRGKDDQQYILEVNSRLIYDARGRPLGIHAIARDVTERKNADARQALLVRELQHRSKNLLAVVQSIVNNTVARSRDLTSAKDAIGGRLQALARAQDFVASGAAGGVPLGDLVGAAVSPFASQMHINGDPIVIGGTFAQTFALVLHELATNATKYGSLSRPHGRVLVSWEVERPDDKEPQLRFTWKERGGPSVKSPTVEGFGTELISAVSEGASRVFFGEDGFEFEVEVPMSKVMMVSKFE